MDRKLEAENQQLKAQLEMVRTNLVAAEAELKDWIGTFNTVWRTTGAFEAEPLELMACHLIAKLVRGTDAEQELRNVYVAMFDKLTEPLELHELREQLVQEIGTLRTSHRVLTDDRDNAAKSFEKLRNKLFEAEAKLLVASSQMEYP